MAAVRYSLPERRARIAAALRTVLVHAALSPVFWATPLHAQQPAPTAVASGVVYDSLARRPLVGATVEFVNATDPGARPFTAVSDASGRYTITNIPYGQYVAGFFHAALDTLGLEAPPRRVIVDRIAERIDLATPSARTVTASLCGPGAVSDSTGLLLGHLRATETQVPVPGGTIIVEWNETVIGAEGVRQRTRQIAARAEEPGWFAMCAVPSDVVVQGRAFSGADSSGYVDIDVPANGVRHATFYIGGASLVAIPTEDTLPGGAVGSETALRGGARLTGTVVDHAARPVVGAHVSVWGTKLAASTNERGAFALEVLPGGTHTVEVRAIGYAPVTSTVHLAASRPATAAIELTKAAEILPTVTVRGELVYSRNLAEFDRRRRSGWGTFRTAADIEQRGRNVRLSALLQDVLGIRVDRRAGTAIVTMRRNATTGIGRSDCVPSLYVDGMLDRAADYDAYFSDEIAGIEVYPRESTRPYEFIDPTNACGAVAIWTRPLPPRPKK